MDLFVLSSMFESFGNVALEAALFGKAVVGTRIGGLPEAVADGETGILVPPSDARALSGALLRLLQNKDKREAMGGAGRKRVLQYFTPKRVADEVENVYARVLRDGCGVQ
jgi:glycosyltransferase involved in cell wall biosynthesis